MDSWGVHIRVTAETALLTIKKTPGVPLPLLSDFKSIIRTLGFSYGY